MMRKRFPRTPLADAIFRAEPGSHHPLSPSSSSRWLECLLAPHLEIEIPEEPSGETAVFGTEAHEEAEAVLTTGKQLDTERFAELIKYTTFINELPGRKEYEIRLDLSPWIPMGYGTADTVVIDEDESTLHVIDLKYGFNRVSAQSNSQLLYYLLGAKKRYSWLTEFTTYKATIVQPRLDWIDCMQISQGGLESWGNAAQKKAEKIVFARKHPPATPGLVQCQWCRARGVCRARAQTYIDLFDEVAIESPNAS